MKSKRVSVAEGKKSFTQLLRQVEKEKTAVLIFRRDRFVAALLPADAYEHLERLEAYFQALRLSKQLAHLQVNAAELAHQARRELEERFDISRD